MRCENINVIPQNEQSPPILTHLAHGNVARLNLLMGFQASPLENDKKRHTNSIPLPSSK
jgi:hypothetical protein